MIRQQRFQQGAGLANSSDIIQKLEADKIKKQERALKFGLTNATDAVDDEKRKERLNRFKVQEDQARQVVDEDQDKKAARAARFNTSNTEMQDENPVPKKRGPLEFTLDEYKTKKDDFLKKRSQGGPGIHNKFKNRKPMIKEH